MREKEGGERVEKDNKVRERKGKAYFADVIAIV